MADTFRAEPGAVFRTENNYCPINPSGHRYFIFKTYEVFETIQDDLIAEMSQVQLYHKVEYAILGCNCSAVTKQIVKAPQSA